VEFTYGDKRYHRIRVRSLLDICDGSRVSWRILLWRYLERNSLNQNICTCMLQVEKQKQLRQQLRQGNRYTSGPAVSLELLIVALLRLLGEFRKKKKLTFLQILEVAFSVFSTPSWTACQPSVALKVVDSRPVRSAGWVKKSCFKTFGIFHECWSPPNSPCLSCGRVHELENHA